MGRENKCGSQDGPLPEGGAFQKGCAVAWPIWVGYLPLGIAFGVLAQKAGLSPLAIMVMSVGVFAGSGQFIAVSMMTSGADIGSIVITTGMVNLRHLLMSSSLAVYLQRVARWKLTLMASGITDETYAINMIQFRKGHWGISLATVVTLTCHTAWVASTVIGGLCGQYISENAFGIDYALVAMFICLFIFQLNGWVYAVTGVAAAALSVVISLYLPGNWYIMIASVLAATLGLCLKRFVFVNRRDT